MWAEFSSVFVRLPRDPMFADDLEKVNNAEHTTAPPWN